MCTLVAPKKEGCSGRGRAILAGATPRPHPPPPPPPSLPPPHLHRGGRVAVLSGIVQVAAKQIDRSLYRLRKYIHSRSIPISMRLHSLSRVTRR